MEGVKLGLRRVVDQITDDLLSFPPTVSHEQPATDGLLDSRPQDQSGLSGDVPEERQAQVAPIADGTANEASTTHESAAGPVRNRATLSTPFSPYSRQVSQSPGQDILPSALGQTDVRPSELPTEPTRLNNTLTELEGQLIAAEETPDSPLGTAGASVPDPAADSASRNSRLRQFQRNFGIRDDIYEQAEQLFDIPEAERWPIAVILMMSALRQNQRISDLAQPPAVPVNIPQPHRYSAAFKTFIRGHLGQILLRGDIERYGRPVGRAADRGYISKAPLPIMRKIIDDQPESVRANYLPSDYNTSITAVPELLKLIRELLKNEKSTFADAILDGTQMVSPDHYRPMPTLDQLVIHLFRELDFTLKHQSDAEIHGSSKLTHQVRVRIAYLRFQLNVHRRQLRQSSFWEIIDLDLAEKKAKSPAYQAAFAHLILQKDRQIWNGTNTISDVPDDTQGLPTELEIQAHVQRIEEQSGQHLNRARS